MSDDSTTTTDAGEPAETADATGQQGQAQPKPTETVDFWKQKAREQERRAKANADAATRLAEIEESQKSEAQKAADRVAQLEQEASSARAEALRFKVATKFGIGDEDADLFLTATDEETLTRQAERLAERNKAPAPTPGVYVPQSGHQPSAPALNSDDLERALRAKLGIS
ncbi:hypothetical protein ACPXB3_21350 [Gordonia sp. DT219]|uniref:hypothetical protein n=1 Tax=Gordonia sp. DT219 TaxID=3416658 RepID=UPI003CE7599A